MSRRKRKAVSGDSTAPPNGPPEIGRFSSRRKVAAVLELLRGEALDTVSRKLGVTAATLSQWREQFLAGGQANLKSRAPDARDAEILRLRAKIGEITMANELLLARCHTLEAGLPLAPRRRSA